MKNIFYLFRFYGQFFRLKISVIFNICIPISGGKICSDDILWGQSTEFFYSLTINNNCRYVFVMNHKITSKT